MGAKFTKMPKISPSFNGEGGGGMNHEDRETMALMNIDWSEHTFSRTHCVHSEHIQQNDCDTMSSIQTYDKIPIILTYVI